MSHDLGALIGWYFVHLYPSMIDKFISVSCTHPNLYLEYLSNKSDFNYGWINFVQLPYLPEMDCLTEDIQLINNCFKHLQEKVLNDSKVIEAYKYSFSRKEDWIGPINYYRNLPFMRIATNNNQIIVPTLLISGNQDPLIKLEGIIKSTDYCEKFVMKVVEGAGHFPHQEDPDVFNKYILNYLLAKPAVTKSPERNITKGFMNRMFGAVSSTVKYGNSVLEGVQKRTNGVVSLPGLHVQNTT